MDKQIAFPPEFLLNVQQEIQIDAPADIVFEAILDQAGPGFITPDGKSMSVKLEAWPGGRWFRDLGNNTGHLWGHVQVIKPPTILELIGPMFMSYPVASHVQYRVTEQGKKSTLTLTHRAIGLIDQQHREGVNKGWGHILEQIKAKATR
jgi:uncharacterized protein YndB with AHSA1/START domain